MAPDKKGKKRGRDEDGEPEQPGPSGGSGGGPTIGQQTSYIRNKQVRAEKYAKLKHKQKVWGVCGVWGACMAPLHRAACALMPPDCPACSMRTPLRTLESS